MTEIKVKRHRAWWVRLLKWLGITIGILVVLIVGVCSLIVWTLTPAKLTPLVEEQASKYLRADVRAQRIELTFWHTFPRLTLDIDSLSLRSRTLDSLPAEVRRQLPPDAAQLFSLGRFHGGLNLASLMVGKLHLYDVEFEQMAVNLLQVNDTVANYHILDLESDDEPLELPDISLHKFEILDAAPLRFRSLADGTDFTLSLQKALLENREKRIEKRDVAAKDSLESTAQGSSGSEEVPENPRTSENVRERPSGSEKLPLYRLELQGSLSTPLLEAFNFATLTFGANGTLGWRSSHPYALTIDELHIAVDQYRATLWADLDFADDPRVNSLWLELPDLSVPGLLTHAPAALQTFITPLKTDMQLSATLELTHPWALADTLMPSMRAYVDISPCALTYQQLKLRQLAARFDVDFDGRNIDATKIHIANLRLDGESVDLRVEANISRLLSDPYVDGSFQGSMNLAKMPQKLRNELPVTLTGTVLGDARFRFAMSDLNRDNFHRLRASGQLTLRDIHASADGMGTAYMRQARMEFGTDRSFTHGDTRVDSLLQVTLDIDTLGANALGMDLALARLHASVGTLNRRQSADTAEINPFGGLITLGRLKFTSAADTMRVRLREAVIHATLRRFEGGARSPLINLGVAMKRAMAGQGLNRVSLNEADMQLTLHQRHRSQRADSLAAARRAAPAPRDTTGVTAVAGSHGPDISFDLDQQERRALRRWDFDGHIAAKRGRLTTPLFPLRNTLTNIDLRFSQDSILLHDLQYRAGGSDFLVNGTISNLRRALVSRRNNTLNVDLSLQSDTVNVNELVHALFAGGTLSQSMDSTQVWADNDAEPDLQAAADTAAAGAFLVPANINARLRAKANHVLYSDLQLHDLRGTLLVLDGAINLRDFWAATEIGNLGLQALYAAPDTANMEFGMGLQIHDFRLDRLSSLIPAIDSLLPPIRNFAGIVSADVALTSDLYPNMDLDIPTMRAAIKIEGDSLVLLDPDMFKSLSKWLMFKNKKRNMIDHMAVEVVVENSSVELYPFMFDIDRYRLGVMGHNDLAMNLDYHISVLKSPIPWKFGINIKGDIDNMKIRLGGAKIKPGMTVERQSIADNTRVNLVQQIDNVFRRGLRNARMGRLNFQNRHLNAADTTATELPDSVLTSLHNL